MKIECLAYVQEVANCQSITAAAKKLYMSQTTLSAIIRSVEEELGVQLFRRVSKGVMLTDAGLKILPMIQDVTIRYEHMANLYQNNHSIGKNVHILLYPAACSDFSIELSSQLRQRYPDLTPVFHRASQDKVIPQLLDGVANVAISSFAYVRCQQVIETCHNSNLHCDILCEDSFCLCVTPDSKFAGQEMVSLDELKDEHRASAQFYPDSSTSAMADGFRKIRRSTLFTSNESIKMAAVRGEMIAILSKLSLINDPYLMNGSLVAVPLEGFPIQNRLVNFVIYRNPGELTLVEKFFIEQAKIYYANYGQALGADVSALLTD